jgi:hypothetical protein
MSYTPKDFNLNLSRSDLQTQIDNISGSNSTSNLTFLSDFASINNAISTIATSGKTLYVDVNSSLTNDLIIPENISLHFLRGNVISLNNYKLTINGFIYAEPWQIFNTQTGTVSGRGFYKVYPEWFGAVGDGITDDAIALNTSCSVSTGTVELTKKYLVDSANLNIKNSVSVRGNNDIIGNPGFDNNNTTHLNQNGLIYLNNTRTIQLSGSSSISGVLIARKNLTIPENGDDLFAGTALTIVGEDVLIQKCMILGFNLAINCTNHQRIRVSDVNIDCTNGIYINSNFDVGYFNNIHMWPFVTVSHQSPTYTTATVNHYLHRDGYGMKFVTAADLFNVTNVFEYGHTIGFDFVGCAGIKLTNCSSDDISFSPVNPTATISGSKGFNIHSPNVQNTSFVNCQVYSKEIGAYINNNPNSELNTLFTNCLFKQFGSTGIFVGENGDATISNCEFRPKISNTGTGIGLSQLGIDRNVWIDNCYFVECGVGISGSNDPSLLIQKNRFENCTTNISTTTIPTVASSDPLVIEPEYDTIFISGTTSFGTLLPTYAGHKITLIFNNTLTVFTGGTIRLKGNQNLRTIDRTTLTLVCDGYVWNEISVNDNIPKPYYDLKYFGAIGDGVTNDSNALFSAVVAASGGTLYVPRGKYLIDGNVILNNISIVSSSPLSDALDYQDTGSVFLQTNTLAPMFFVEGGVKFENIQFFYPNQTGISANPIVYLPTIKASLQKSVTNLEFNQCQWINAYDCLEIKAGDQSHGRISIVDSKAYAVNSFSKISGLLDVMYCSNLMLTPGIYQDIANTGNQYLRKWTQDNGTAFILENDVDGLNINNSIIYGYNVGVHCLSGHTDFFQINNSIIDSTPTAFKVSDNCLITNTTISNCSFYSANAFNSSYAPSVIDIRCTADDGYITLSNNHFTYSAGRVIDVSNNSLSTVIIDSNHFKYWAQSPTLSGSQSAITITEEDVRTVISSNIFTNTYSNGIGITLKTSNASIGNNIFENCFNCINISGGFNYVVNNNISSETISKCIRISQEPANIVAITNYWDTISDLRQYPSITFETSSSNSTIDIRDLGTQGVGIKLISNYPSAPNKYIRNYGGRFEIINSDYSKVLLSLDENSNIIFDNSNIAISGSAIIGSDILLQPSSILYFGSNITGSNWRIAKDNNSLVLQYNELGSYATKAFFDNNSNISITGSFNGIKIGRGPGNLIYNTSIGYQSFINNTTGYYNTSLGVESLYSNTTGFENTALGIRSLLNNISGYGNTSIGQSTLLNNITGGYNTSVGINSLSNSNGYGNTAIGKDSGGTIITGRHNTLLGFEADSGHSDGNYRTSLGANAICLNDNTIRCGRASTDTLRGYNYTADSDRRLKEDIIDLPIGLNFIMDLRPVSYKWKDRTLVTTTKDSSGNIIQNKIEQTYNRNHCGFIAQEIGETLKTHGVDFGLYQDAGISNGITQELEVDLNNFKEPIDLKGYSPEQLLAIAVKAIQEQQAIINSLQKRIEKLETI